MFGGSQLGGGAGGLKLGTGTSVGTGLQLGGGLGSGLGQTTGLTLGGGLASGLGTGLSIGGGLGGALGQPQQTSGLSLGGGLGGGLGQSSGLGTGLSLGGGLGGGLGQSSGLSLGGGLGGGLGQSSGLSLGGGLGGGLGQSGGLGTGLMSLGGGSLGGGLGQSQQTSGLGTGLNLGLGGLGLAGAQKTANVSTSLGMFNQQSNQSNQQSRVQEALQTQLTLSAIKPPGPSVFGDERDLVLMQFNWLQACSGTGKGLVNQPGLPQSVDFTPDSLMCRFKAICYNRLPMTRNEDGLIALQFKRKGSDLLASQSVITKFLQDIVTKGVPNSSGSTEVLQVVVDSVRPLPDDWYFFSKESLDVPKESIEGTIYCKPGAANALLERVYTLLTSRDLHYLPANGCPSNFNDSVYQSQLPLYTRPTVTQSIKNNTANTELTTEPDRIVCMQKAQAIMEDHLKQKKQDKEDHPEHFGLQMSTGKGKTVNSSLKETPGIATDIHKGAPIEEIGVEQRLQTSVS